ncbi:hypothetical protein [Yersinia frederiksenii]|uniref:hypothetical protein n=1 Tax=Yersinia frederiksenii TaxID=29484 RepID=UPI001643906D|nr:hypothetical protein [Yersinia frederiksenii]
MISNNEAIGGIGLSQAKKSQHPSWLKKHWKQCEQCRAFLSKAYNHWLYPEEQIDDNSYQ